MTKSIVALVTLAAVASANATVTFSNSSASTGGSFVAGALSPTYDSVNGKSSVHVNQTTTSRSYGKVGWGYTAKAQSGYALGTTKFSFDVSGVSAQSTWGLLQLKGAIINTSAQRPSCT